MRQIGSLILFEASIRRLETGQYETILNVDELKVKNLASNYILALRQAKILVQKFQKDEDLRKAYVNEIQVSLDSGFAEKLPQGEKPSYFMPHFPVVKLARTTTKVRPVLSASSHAKNALSLNDCIKDCPNLLPTTIETLIKFRSYPVAVTGDISKACLCIGIQEDFRSYPCFFLAKQS